MTRHYRGIYFLAPFYNCRLWPYVDVDQGVH
jgi:phosphoribosyl 1,2-cyclic phosphodiesterase